MMAVVILVPGASKAVEETVSAACARGLTLCGAGFRSLKTEQCSKRNSLWAQTSTNVGLYETFVVASGHYTR